MSITEVPTSRSVEEATQPSSPLPSTNNSPPLRSEESFAAYCVQVQEKLAAHAVQRIHFLKKAHERLTQLLQAAREVEDENLFLELARHRAAAQVLLDSIQNKVQPTTASASAALSLPEKNGAVVNAPRPLPPLPPSRHATAASVADPSMVRETPAVSIPRPPRRPMRPLSEIESDAVRLRESLRDWNSRFPLANGEGGLIIPNCLRLRAVACRQRRLEEEAGDTEATEVTELSEDIIDLLDAANDQEYTVALDDELDPAPSAYQWGELAERYEDMARAQEAYEWWQHNRLLLAVAEVQPLAEAIAAVQQRFNRLLFRVGARDPFQQQLFDELRTWAREDQCYLYSLRPKVPMSELVERAATLEDSWNRARIPVAGEERKQQLIEAVVALVSDPDFGQKTDQDEECLRTAVLACREARIPASDRRLRDALLPYSAFLEEDDRFKEVVREINLEWERRQEQESVAEEEVSEEADSALDAMGAELEAVRAVTRGKRCLMLGGTCHEENRRKIEKALELEELVWPSTKPSDPLAKFDTELRHSDIVALLTRFSRKEWKNAQDICAREGKKFVHLTTGYGVSQVVRHFYSQITPEGSARE